MKTRGEQITEAIRAYLFTNGLRKSQLTGTIVTEISDRVLDHLDRLEKKKKRLATEETWLKELEGEPHMAGVNIRKELAGAQFWCRNNARVCTRRFFTKWLEKSARDAVLSGGGEKPAAKANGHDVAPAGWLATLNDLYPNSVYAKGGLFEIVSESPHEWEKLDKDVRREIREEAVRG